MTEDVAKRQSFGAALQKSPTWAAWGWLSLVAALVSLLAALPHLVLRIKNRRRDIHPRLGRRALSRLVARHCLERFPKTRRRGSCTERADDAPVDVIRADRHLGAKFGLAHGRLGDPLAGRRRRGAHVLVGVRPATVLGIAPTRRRRNGLSPLRPRLGDGSTHSSGLDGPRLPPRKRTGPPRPQSLDHESSSRGLSRLRRAFLFLHFGLAWRRDVLQPRANLLAALSFGLLYYAYFYFWTAVFAGTVLAWFLDPKGRRLHAQILIVGTLVGLPSLIDNYWIKSSTGTDWLIRTEKFAPLLRFENLMIFRGLLLKYAVVGLWIFRAARVDSSMVRRRRRARADESSGDYKA